MKPWSASLGVQKKTKAEARDQSHDRERGKDSRGLEAHFQRLVRLVLEQVVIDRVADEQEHHIVESEHRDPLAKALI